MSSVFVQFKCSIIICESFLRSKMCLIDFFLFLLNSKISAHEFERGGLLKPIVNTIDGTPTFLSVCPQNDSALCSVSSNIGSTNNNSHRPQRLSRNELRHLDEKQLIFELVRYRMLYNILFNIFYTHAYTFCIRLINNLYFISIEIDFRFSNSWSNNFSYCITGEGYLQ